MRTLFVTTAYLPHPTGNGCSVLMHGILTCLIRLGLQVSVVPVRPIESMYDQYTVHEAYLRQEGIPVINTLVTRGAPIHTGWSGLLRQFVLARSEDFFPTDRGTVAEFLRLLGSIRPEVVLGFDWAATSLTQMASDSIRIASIVDLLESHHRVLRQNLRRRRAQSLVKDLIRSQVITPRICKKKEAYGYDFLRGHNAIIEHAHHHCLRLRQVGIENVYYIPHPLQPATRTDDEWCPAVPGAEVTILLAGSLKGASSLAGFHFLLSELLPLLDSRKHTIKTRFRLRIVGYGSLPLTLHSELCRRPDVDFAGFVDDMSTEWRRADVVLVPIPVSVGFRTRIAEAFSYGKCVVAHAANCAGMPEILDGSNALLGANASEIVDRLIAAIHSPTKRLEIGQNAQATFNRHYSIAAGTKRIGEVLQNCQRHQSAPRSQRRRRP